MDKVKLKKIFIIAAGGFLVMGAIGFLIMNIADYRRRVAEHKKTAEMIRQTFEENKQLSAELQQMDIRYAELLKEVQAKGNLSKEGQENVAKQITMLKELTQDQQSVQKSAEFLGWMKNQFADEKPKDGAAPEKTEAFSGNFALELEGIQKILLEKKKEWKERETALAATEKKFQESAGLVQKLQKELGEKEKKIQSLSQKTKSPETELRPLNESENITGSELMMTPVRQRPAPNPAYPSETAEQKRNSKGNEEPVTDEQRHVVSSYTMVRKYPVSKAPKKAQPQRRVPSKQRSSAGPVHPPVKKAEASQVSKDSEVALLQQRLSDAQRQNQMFIQQLEKLTDEHKTQKESVFYNLGVIYSSTSLYLEAEKMFVKALEIDPKDAAAHYNLAILYDDHLDKTDKAMDHYERYLTLSKDEEKKRQVLNWLLVAKQKTKPRTQTRTESAAESFKRLFITTAG